LKRFLILPDPAGHNALSMVYCFILKGIKKIKRRNNMSIEKCILVISNDEPEKTISEELTKAIDKIMKQLGSPIPMFDTLRIEEKHEKNEDTTGNGNANPETDFEHQVSRWATEISGCNFPVVIFFSYRRDHLNEAVFAKLAEQQSDNLLIYVYALFEPRYTIPPDRGCAIFHIDINHTASLICEYLWARGLYVQNPGTNMMNTDELASTPPD
jgi:hypothetical protein